jgi:hypothetical protein
VLAPRLADAGKDRYLLDVLRVLVTHGAQGSPAAASAGAIAPHNDGEPPEGGSPWAWPPYASLQLILTFPDGVITSCQSSVRPPPGVAQRMPPTSAEPKTIALSGAELPSGSCP